MNSATSVAYISIGLVFTSVTVAQADTSTHHQQRTPSAVARSKKTLHRGGGSIFPASSSAVDEDAPSLVLDLYLRTLCESFQIPYIVDHMVLLVDPTDSKEFITHVLRFLSVVAPSHVSVSSVSSPVFVAAMAGVGRDAVVVDLGHTFTRLVPILHCEEVKSLWMVVQGVGVGSHCLPLKTNGASGGVADQSSFQQEEEPPSSGPAIVPTWSHSLQTLLDDYLGLRLQRDDELEEEGAASRPGNGNGPWVGEVRDGQGGSHAAVASPAVLQASDRIAAQHATEELEYMERFTTSLEEGVEELIRRARARGMGTVLNTWIITGGGAQLPSVKNFLGYILSLLVPEAILIWA